MKTYIDNYRSIFTVLREAISLLDFTKSEVSYMSAIFQELGTLSMDICLHVGEVRSFWHLNYIFLSKMIQN